MELLFQLKFKVGEVVEFIEAEMTCVVIGWDKVMRAPERWAKVVSVGVTFGAHLYVVNA